jgi:hypothetical protein
MPITPSVFRAIRKNDVHQRPFKAYKNYVVTSSIALADKYGIQKASHKKFAINAGDATYNYPINSTDETNQHVVWKWIDHRYYRYPYDQTRCVELTNRDITEKQYFMTASVITVPYHQMGERIKPNTVTLNSRVTESSTNAFNATFNVTASDDGYGNLRDVFVPTASMASSSRCRVYVQFNDEFRNFDNNFGTLNSPIEYRLHGRTKRAEAFNVEIQNGIDVFVSSSVYVPSGLSAFFTGSLKSSIKLNDSTVFNQTQRCDQWAMSFWINPVDLVSTGSIISKLSNVKEVYFDPIDKLQKIRTVNNKIPIPGRDFSKHRTPFHISLIGDQIHFQSSNGTNALDLSAPIERRGDWSHVLIQNSASLCTLYVNGMATGSSGSIPRDSTANSANVLLGTDTLNTSSAFTYNGGFAEMRLYDYALSSDEIDSLSNIDFYTGSLYQTSRIGNVFYRNGQIVVSSPMPKYHDILFNHPTSGSNSFKLVYKGQHTIYENEVMVRIPRSTFNISTNPSAVYRPATGINNECNTDSGPSESNRPGDFIKKMFVSGTANPYITSIGLYNDDGQMLAVGKLAEPVEKRDDIDMNFIIRWDY